MITTFEKPKPETSITDLNIVESESEIPEGFCPYLTQAFGDYTQCQGELCQMWKDDDCGLKRK